MSNKKLVDSMVDMLPSEVWNPSTKFLDLACKGGEFLHEIYARLMKTESFSYNSPCLKVMFIKFLFITSYIGGYKNIT